MTVSRRSFLATVAAFLTVEAAGFTKALGSCENAAGKQTIAKKANHNQ
jgi:hypothetical protein